jgi:hypothetical protein
MRHFLDAAPAGRCSALLVMLASAMGQARLRTMADTLDA